MTPTKSYRLVSLIEAPGYIQGKACDYVNYRVYQIPHRLLRILTPYCRRYSEDGIILDKQYVPCYGELFFRQHKKPNWIIDWRRSRQFIVCEPSCNSLPNTPYCSRSSFAPSDGTSVLDEKTFVRWMQLCQKNHVLSSKAEYYRNGNKNVMRIPFLQNYHSLYTSLCAYRLSDSSPDIVWTIVNTLKENPDLHFWQVVACCSERNKLYHSFLLFSHWNTQRNFQLSLAIQRFLVQKSQQLDCRNESTHSGILELEMQLAGLSIPENDSILNTKWAVLYEMADQPVEEIKRVYDELVKA